MYKHNCFTLKKVCNLLLIAIYHKIFKDRKQLEFFYWEDLSQKFTHEQKLKIALQVSWQKEDIFL